MKSIIPNLRKNSIAALYSIGLALSILSVFSMHSVMVQAVIIIVGLSLLSIAMGISKQAKWISLIAVAVLLVLLLLTGFLGNFIHSLMQMFKAMALFFMGTNHIFLAYASTFSIVVALLSYFIAQLFSDEYVSFIPMLLLLSIAMYVVLQIGVGLDYIYTLPAWLALLYKALHRKKTLDIKSNLVVVAILALCFLLLPLVMHPVKPLNDMAKDIKERIKDYLFFTKEREIFSIEDYGYYPFGINRFGGKPEINDTPVLTVETPHKLLLRGITKDLYTGLSFQNSRSTSRYLYVNPRWRALRTRSLLEDYPLALNKEGYLKESNHKVQLYTDVHTTLLIPAYLKKLVTNSDMIPYFNESGEVFITRNLAPYDSYTFSVPHVEGGLPGLDVLVERAASQNDSLYEQILQSYLQLPEHLEGPLYDLKDKIIRGADTPYAKALALMNYLKNSYRYNLDVKEPPIRADFVTHFLFQSKEGYCTYFAASMTVLARMAGLPARYAEGFVANPDSDNLARVTGKEAHAWAEIYFKGFGWIPFDATAPAPNNNPNNNPPPPLPEDENPPPDEPTPSPPPPEEEENPPEEPPEDEENPPEESPTPTPPPAPPPPETQDEKSYPFLIILLILLSMFTISLMIYLLQPEQITKREVEQERRLRIWARATLALLQNWRKDVPKYNKLQTIYDYVAKINRHFPIDLYPFAQALNRHIYAKSDNWEKEETIMRETYQTLFPHLAWYKKLKIILWNAWMAYRE